MKLKAFAKGVLTMAGITGGIQLLYGLVKRYREEKEEERKHDEEFEALIKKSEEQCAWLAEFTKNYGKETDDQALWELVEEYQRRYPDETVSGPEEFAEKFCNE